MLFQFFVFHITCALANPITNDNFHNLAWLFGADRRSIQNDIKTSVCESEECRMLGKTLKESMNETIDPCEDFYEYTCGNWAKNNPIPSGMRLWSFFRNIQYNHANQILDLLSTDFEQDDLAAIKLAKRYYRTCMDEERREKQGLVPLIETINRIGGWPMIMDANEWDEFGYSWQLVDDYYASLTGENAFHKIKILEIFDDPKIKITPAEMPVGASGLISDEVTRADEDIEDIEKKDSDERDSQELGSREDYGGRSNNTRENKVTSKQQYVNLITKVALALARARGVDIPREQLDKDVNDMCKFIMELHKVSVKPGERKFMLLSNLHKWYNNLEPNDSNSKIMWIEKVVELFDDAGVDIDTDIEIMLPSRVFLEELRELLQKTPRRTIVNYVHWRFISDMIKTTTNEMQILHKKIVNVSGVEIILPQTKKEKSIKCLTEVEMWNILGYVFVKKYFPKEVQEKAHEMIRLIQDEVQREIRQSKWLDEESKSLLTEKVENIKKKVGYPTWYTNTSVMKNYYKGFMVGSSYYENIISYRKYEARKYLQTLYNRTKDGRYEDEPLIPLMINAMYSPLHNMILITAPNFKDPLYALSRPSIINFGIIGSVIGHEVNHGFDIRGFKYGKDGTIIEWINQVVDEYTKRSTCFIEQYNNYSTAEGLNADYGRWTLNENIADTMGLEAALGAYYLSKGKGEDDSVQTLPGLEDFTPEKLFFLSYAILHCEVDTEDTKKKYKGDEHCPGRLRVIGSLSNSQTFANTFNCPKGSPMNPPTKCNIWN